MRVGGLLFGSPVAGEPIRNSPSAVAVPEPPTTVLLGVSAIGSIAYGRRRRARGLRMAGSVQAGEQSVSQRQAILPIPCRRSFSHAVSLDEAGDLHSCMSSY